MADYDDGNGMFEVRGPSLEECIRRKNEAIFKGDTKEAEKWAQEEEACRSELKRLAARNLALIKSGWLTD